MWSVSAPSRYRHHDSDVRAAAETSQGECPLRSEVSLRLLPISKLARAFKRGIGYQTGAQTGDSQGLEAGRFDDYRVRAHGPAAATAGVPTAGGQVRDAESLPMYNRARASQTAPSSGGLRHQRTRHGSSQLAEVLSGQFFLGLPESEVLGFHTASGCAATPLSLFARTRREEKPCIPNSPADAERNVSLKRALYNHVGSQAWSVSNDAIARPTNGTQGANLQRLLQRRQRNENGRCAGIRAGQHPNRSVRFWSIHR